MVMAQIYSLVGEFDKAIDELEFLLSIPSWSTPALLKADPIFAPLMDNHRLREILAKHENSGS